MATEQKASGTKIISKLTIRDVVGSKPKILAAAMTGRANDEAKDGKPVPIMRVLGQVQGFQAGEGDNGAYIKLRGLFQATNLLTGEIIDNVPIAILPNTVGDLLAGIMVGGAKSVDFAIEVDVQYDEAAATMYVYSFRSLMKAATSAPVQAIQALLESSGVKLTAPRLEAPKDLTAAQLKAQDAAQKAADAGKEKAKDKAKETAKA